MVLPREWISYLGVLPLLLGLKQLIQLRSEPTSNLPSTTETSRSGLLTVAGTTLASGGDNVGVYAPLFATMRPSDIAVMVAAFIVLIGLWCALTRWIVKRALPLKAPHRTFKIPHSRCPDLHRPLDSTLVKYPPSLCSSTSIRATNLQSGATTTGGPYRDAVRVTCCSGFGKPVHSGLRTS